MKRFFILLAALVASITIASAQNYMVVNSQKIFQSMKEYNTAIRKFPKNILAGMFGFEKRPYFEAQEGVEKAPVVQF